MAQLSPNRRKAALAASATVVLVGAMLILTEVRGWGGADSWGQFVLGAVVGLALVFAIVYFVKWRSRDREPGP